MNLKEASEWAIRQPDGISCGAACSAMAANILLDRNGGETNLTPLMIREMMGTNPQTGTTDAEMRRSMLAWGMRGVRKVPSEKHDGEERLGLLKAHLEADGIAMLRLMKFGCRHWNVAVGYEGGYVLLEPGTGRAEIATAEQLAGWMAPRGWEFWQINPDSPCRSLTMRHVQQPGMPSLSRAVINLTERIFTPHTGKGLDYASYMEACSDWKLSVALTDGDRLLGAYALKEYSADDFFDEIPDEKPGNEKRSELKESVRRIAEHFGNLKGVQGVSLVVPEHLRGCGYGHLLRCMPGELGFGWSYGIQLKSLRNLEKWQKVREHTEEISGCWVTGGRVKPIRPMTIADMRVALTAEYDNTTISEGNKP